MLKRATMCDVCDRMIPLSPKRIKDHYKRRHGLDVLYINGEWKHL